MLFEYFYSRKEIDSTVTISLTNITKWNGLYGNDIDTLTISIQNLFLPIASTLLHMNILASTFLGVKETILLYCDFKIIYVRFNFFNIIKYAR